MSSGWTTPADIERRVRRRWDDGSLHRAWAGEATFVPIEVPLRGPSAAEIGDDLVKVREWIATLEARSAAERHYGLVMEPIGGRHIGRNVLPTRAIIATVEQALALLRVRRDMERFDEILALTADVPAVRSWVLAHPHAALELRDAVPSLIAAFAWLDSHRGSGHYLREISAPGVDTKFAEKHRGVLAAMLGVSATSSGFLSDLGLRAKPELVRIRVSHTLGLPTPVTELALRAAELAQLSITPRSALIIENEITYLSVDVPEEGIVVWGKGFEVDRVGRLPWLADVPIFYWGDIDTHGFAILDRLRAWLPSTRSVLMDRQTLLEHRERWVSEPRPATSTLTRLSAPEHDLYTDLVTDRLGPRIRLEQELVDWTWATSELTRSAAAASE